MLRAMRTGWLLAALLIPATVLAETLTLTAEHWARPRSAAYVASLPEVRRAIEIYERQPQGVIVLHHATTEEAGLWAEELRGWLVALGLPGERIVTVTELRPRDTLRIEVRAHGAGS
jgi:hypothetical protein